MATTPDLKELFEKALSIWRNSGQDFFDGNDLAALQKDPVVKLLLGAVAYQSGLLQEETEVLQSSLLDNYLRISTQVSQMLVTPAVGMMRVGKGVSAGNSNTESTVLDENFVFRVSASGQASPHGVQFMPVLKTLVADAEVVEVEQLAGGKWRVAIAENESLGSLEGLSLLIRGVPGNSTIRISSGGVTINHLTLQDLGSLPFVAPLAFLSGAEGYAAQYRLLQQLMDGFCLADYAYCILNGMKASQPRRSGGCVHLELELPSSVRLTRDEVLLGCVPVVNLSLEKIQLSRERPIARIEEKSGSFFASTTAAAEVRRVGTERLNAKEWAKRLDRLISQYEENYSVFGLEMDNRMSAALQQLLPALSEINSVPTSSTKYIVLSDPLVSGIDASYLISNGSMANGLDEDATVEVNSAEIDAARTHLVSKTAGGKDETELTSEIQSHQKYFAQTGDRIITRADIGNFCRYMLQYHFGIPNENVLDLSIVKSIDNNQHGFYERYTLVEIRIKKTDKDIRRISSALERLMVSRMANPAPVRISITQE